ncbi:MAG: ATP-binding cassette domain-containing protein [Candidatus Sericytochromatia bacterium]|nr:ATP-binding cassette domain-containing protein [Candidatus Sericytochromatia bacterium]
MIDLDLEFKRDNFYLKVQINTLNKSTGIFGNSGSGKTTLFNLISGVIKPDRGYIRINNITLFDSYKKINVHTYKRQMGYVFQDNNLFPHLKINKNLTYGYELLQKSKIKFEPQQIIKLLELEKVLHKYPNQLSGGEKKRVAIGRAILSSPELLLFDEPLSSLDETLKDQVLSFLKKIIEEVNIPMLYISHSRDEINFITDNNILHIENGLIQGS